MAIQWNDEQSSISFADVGSFRLSCQAQTWKKFSTGIVEIPEDEWAWFVTVGGNRLKTPSRSRDAARTRAERTLRAWIAEASAALDADADPAPRGP